jgi:hypothetical protein
LGVALHGPTGHGGGQSGSQTGTQTGTQRQTLQVTQYGSSVHVVHGTWRTHSCATIRQVTYGTLQQRSSVT